MDIDPCNICGGTEVNLIDGYKYCVECGTQNENFKETVVEYQIPEDNVLFKTTKKIITQPDLNKENFDAEWLKWHTFNFILTGLIDQVISLGAKPSVKTKLLWIWKRYVTKYRVKKGDKREGDHNTLNEDTDDESDVMSTADDDEFEKSHNVTQKLYFAQRKLKGGVITITILYTLIYMALNYDRDDIQASDLVRYIREGRLSYKKCIQLIPKGLDYNKILHWKAFLQSIKNVFSVENLRYYSFRITKELDLGAPVTPNMIKLCNRYIKELALPKDLMTFILCLMSIIPPFNKDFTNNILRWPQYEERAMSYIVVSMKLLFGLDDVSEYHLDIVSKDVNQSNNYEKLLRSDMFFEKSQRTFVWTDWMRFITYRKFCLSKFYYPIAAQVNALNIDVQLFVSHYCDDLEKQKNNMDYSSQLTFQVLQKLSNNNPKFTSRRLSFPPSLTPMSTYTEVLINSKWIKKLNEEIILEDFYSYSLNHIIKESFSKGRPFENKFEIAENGLIKNHLFVRIPVDKTEKIVTFTKTVNTNETINQRVNDIKESNFETLTCTDMLQATLSVNLGDEVELSTVPDGNDDILSMRSDKSTNNMEAITTAPTLNPQFARDEAIRSILDVYLEKYHLRKMRPRKRTKDDFVIYNPNYKRDKLIKQREQSNDTRKNVDNILVDYFHRLQNLVSNSFISCDGDDNFRLNDRENQNATNLNKSESLDACDVTDLNMETELYTEPLNASINSVEMERSNMLNSVQDNLINDEPDHSMNVDVKDEIDELDCFVDSFNDEFTDIDFSRFNKSKEALIETLPNKIQEKLEIDGNKNLSESVSENSQNNRDVDEGGIKQDINEISNSSTDVPLNTFQDTTNISQASINCARKKELLSEECQGEQIVYWIRHYISHYRSEFGLRTRFTKELDTFFPASFTWFLKLCASTIEIANTTLYKEVGVLEESLMVNLPSLRKAQS